MEVPLEKDLMMTSHPEKLEAVLQTLFEVPDWTKVTKEELNAFLRKLSDLQ